MSAKTHTHHRKGALARVTSAVGSIDPPVEITDDIVPGVVSVPHGFGHHRQGIRFGVAQEQAAGASLSDITKAPPTMALGVESGHESADRKSPQLDR